MKRETLTEKQARVLYSFDFAQVASNMRELNWRWRFGCYKDRVPTEDELRETAARLLASLSTKVKANSSGGLRAARDGKEFVLTFELTRAESARFD